MELQRREFIKLTSLISLSYTAPAFFALPGKENNQANPPNILIVLFDTLSALHLSLYGYPRQTTPNIERFARSATVYHNHYSGGIFTTPGTASLLTGTYPFTHRALAIQDRVIPKFETRNIFTHFSDYYRLGYAHNLLADELLNQFVKAIDNYTERDDLFLHRQTLVSKIFDQDADNAYLSWFRISDQSNEGFGNSLFLQKLIKEWRERQIKSLEREDFPRGVPSNRGDPFVLEDAIEWAKSQLTALPQPFLSYIHLVPPHNPYNTRREFINQFLEDGHDPERKPEHYLSQGYSYETLVRWHREYDEYILYIDAEFGRLYDHLRSSGLLENTWLILTSDHGEMFERGIWEHTVPAIFQPVIRIPLLISAPGQTERQDVHDLTSAVDVLATLSQVTGKPLPDWSEGQVLPPFNKDGLEPGRSIFAMDAKKNDKLGEIRHGTLMIVEWPYKLMEYVGNKNVPGPLYYELFNLEEDPEELENLYQPDLPLALDLIEKLHIRLDDSYKKLNF